MRSSRSPERLFKSLGKQVVLLLAFLSNHGLNGAAQVRYIAGSGRADEADE